jgi:sodium/potassium-transporting ATPase subunit alpha
MGERVLAFSRLKLDPAVYKKDYPFDVKKWKFWKDETAPGWFPMNNMQLVGLISLNDPPRPSVDISVLKCRAAGIKVIMVTGDQPPTAAAIAHKVNIIMKPELEYNYLLEHNPNMSEADAFAMCTGIVIHGDELARVHAAEEALDDNEIEKGRKIMDWIRKPEVVFARTTPSQKLLIVDACQRLGHIVAVTGDGVNDSPAIKKANIGIAMGSGSDVAQNAADMLLLDDNFSSIVNGVEEGRLIFDNLKKSIAYTLTSNIPEIWPFVFFIIFSVPLPLTTVLILCIDLGTDMVPAIAFAYEHPELDIMERYPRNSKVDYLVGKKMISFSYLQVGMIQQFGAIFCYFTVMNDYGFRPSTLFFLDPEIGYFPKASDVYNPNLPHNGNTNFGNDNFKDKMEWLKTDAGGVDLRLFYTSRAATAWSQCRWKDGEEHEGPRFYRYSEFTGKQICYTTDALKNAHTAYLVGIVCLQWATCIAAKTRSLSIAQQGFINGWGNVGLISETVLILIITYVPFINIPLATRPVAFPHCGVPVWPWVITIFLFDEMRKIYLRAGMKRKASGQVVLDGWVARNTYY